MSPDGRRPPEFAAELVRRLYVLLKAALVYGPENEAYRAHAACARETLARAVESAGAVSLELQEDSLFLNGILLPVRAGEFAALRSLADELGSRGIGAVEFGPGWSAPELDALAFAFRGPRGPAAFARMRAALAAAGALGVRLRPSGAPARAEDEAGSARRSFLQAVRVVEDAMSVLRRGAAPDLDALRAAAARLADEVVKDRQALFELALIHRFDEYTYAHCVNVSVYSIALGQRLGLESAPLRELGLAGLFHDAGKARLPKALIDKPDAFTREEWEQMRRHPEIGARLLLSLGGDCEPARVRAALVALEHHRGFDGRGYPALARPRRQDLFSRVCAIADAFDAMSSGRVYAKRPVPPDEALRRLLQSAGSAFDPLLLRLFVSVAGVFPIGTLLLLDTGERAVVRRNRADDLLHPELALITDSVGRPVAPSPASLGDADESGRRRAVLRTMDPAAEGLDVPAALRALSEREPGAPGTSVDPASANRTDHVRQSAHDERRPRVLKFP